MSQPDLNLANIENLKRIYQTESSILWSRAQSVQIQSLVEENRFLNLQNFSAAFLGNRQLINQNTDDIFRDRYNLLKNTPTKNTNEKEYIDALEAQSRIDILEHRSKLNYVMQEANIMMAAINRQLSEVVEMMQETNDQLISFNNRNLDKNTELLQNINQATSSVESQEISAIEEENLARLKKLQVNAMELEKSIADVVHVTHSNREAILKRTKYNENSRTKILETRKHLADQLLQIEKLIGSS